jgi:hypothetical protein
VTAVKQLNLAKYWFSLPSSENLSMDEDCAYSPDTLFVTRSRGSDEFTAVRGDGLAL